jgi:hypothetical protein
MSLDRLNQSCLVVRNGKSLAFAGMQRRRELDGGLIASQSIWSPGYLSEVNTAA